MMRTLLVPLIVTSAAIGALRAQTAYDFSIIADNTNPEFAGKAFGAHPSINDSGAVAFVVDTVGAFVAEEGQAPVRLGESSVGNVYINRLGEVGLRRWWDIQTELYKKAVNGPEVVLVRTGTEFRSVGGPFLSPSAVAVFYAVKNPVSPGHRGIFTANGNGTTQMVVDNLGEFAYFGGEPTIDSQGRVAFVASKDTINNVIGEEGIYLGTIGGNGVARTVITREASPLYRLGDPHLNEVGEIAFKAYEDQGGEPGVFVVNADGTNLRTVARATGIGFPGPYSMFDPPIINDAGTVVFHAHLDTGGRGIFTGADPERDKVIAVNDPLFGSSAESVVFRRGLNNRDEIVFYFKLTDGRAGIAKARPAMPRPLPTELGRTGTAFTLSVDAASEYVYQLERSGPDGTSFETIGQPQRGATGSRIQFTDMDATGPMRLYRVRISPASG